MQGSTWVLQARRMDGRIGPLTVLPDQMNTINPLIILIMVPIFEAYLYPLTRKMVHVTPLRKMGVGGVLIGISFVMAGILQVAVASATSTALITNFYSIFNFFITCCNFTVTSIITLMDTALR